MEEWYPEKEILEVALAALICLLFECVMASSFTGICNFTPQDPVLFRMDCAYKNNLFSIFLCSLCSHVL